jgi:quaternary ammonium compound-resistance protein SugE
MVWFYVLLGGFMDIGWAIGLKLSQGLTRPVPTIAMLLCLITSYVLYAKSVRVLPIGTAYAVFSGIGTVGTVMGGMLFFNEPKEWLRIGFVFLMLVGIMGLKRLDSSESLAKKSTTRLREEV